MPMTRATLWNKTNVFMERAIARRDAGEFEEFQLWAIMALEVLGKAALAHIHPALVADPQDFESLLAACGAATTTDCRTIQAKTVFARCKRLVKGYDEKCERFCLQMARDRNAELHSGAVPLAGIALEAWQPMLWLCVRLLASAQGESLQTLLGDAEGDRAEAIIDDASQALHAAVVGRVDRARADFLEGRSVMDRGHVASAARVAVEAKVDESSTAYDCPACGCAGILSGSLTDEEPGDHSESEPWLQWVKQTFSSENFHCVACRLHLDGEQELEAGEVETFFEKENLRDLSEEEPYGND